LSVAEKKCIDRVTTVTADYNNAVSVAFNIHYFNKKEEIVALCMWRDFNIYVACEVFRQEMQAVLDSVEQEG